MDLAKIRQKARGGKGGGTPACPAAFQPDMPKTSPRFDEVLEREQGPEALLLAGPTALAADISFVNDQPPRRNTSFDPVERILAGREAAGCGDIDLQTMNSEEYHRPVEDYEEFLCIRVADETYGINIMQIKEIIKPRSLTEIPRAPSFVSGVISLRGVITPIIDLLVRLGLSRESATGKERVVVVKNGDELCGLMVDEVTKVVRIPKNKFESAPAVLEGIDRDFVSGIGRAENLMIILLNTESITDINLY